MISRGERATKLHPKARRRSVSLRLVLGGFIAIIMAIGGSHAISGYLLLQHEQQQAFASKNSAAASSILSGLNEYNDLLYVGLGFLQNSQTTTQQEWDGFFRSQDVFNRYPGVSSIYYVKVLTANNRDETIRAVRSQMQDQSLDVHPASSDGKEAVVALFTTNNEVPNPFLFNTYADPIRRSIFEEAALKHKTTSSPVITFIGGQDGIFIASPIYQNGLIAGFVTASFRMDQLMASVIPQESSLVYKISDTTPDDDGENILFSSDGWLDDGQRQTGSVYTTVGSRVWRIETADIDSLRQTSTYIVPISGAAITLVFAIITVLVGRYYIRRIEANALRKD